MTLLRSNPDHARSVIDRTDDSIHHVRAGVVGRPGLYLDSLIEALRGAGFTTWWAGAASPTGGVLDRLASKSADLVLFNVGKAAPTQAELSLIGRLTDRGLRVVAIDGGDNPRGASECTRAGAVWAIDPATAGFDELVSAMRMAYSLRNPHGRGVRSTSSSRPESSVLTMPGSTRDDKDARDRGWQRPRRGRAGKAGQHGRVV